MDAENSSEKQTEASDGVTLQLKEKLGEIDRQLLTMEWDKKQNQFNPGMESKYIQLKAEHDSITKKLNGEAAPAPDAAKES